MNRIFLVVADYCYEGQQAVRGFATEAEANAFCARCEDWRERRLPDSQCPAPNDTTAYFFDVEEIPFGEPTAS